MVTYQRIGQPVRGAWLSGSLAEQEGSLSPLHRDDVAKGGEEVAAPAGEKKSPGTVGKKR